MYYNIFKIKYLTNNMNNKENVIWIFYYFIKNLMTKKDWMKKKIN